MGLPQGLYCPQVAATERRRLLHGDVCEWGRAAARPPGLGQGHARVLPQAPDQLARLLHQHVGGDDGQVEGQQLVTPDGLSRVVLAVVAQELPAGGKGRAGFRSEAAQSPGPAPLWHLWARSPVPRPPASGALPAYPLLT